ncbi:MAG: hypothetical protein RUDDFDWM_000587 [Candidatus Fervidibacterota bacterium]
MALSTHVGGRHPSTSILGILFAFFLSVLFPHGDGCPSHSAVELPRVKCIVVILADSVGFDEVLSNSMPFLSQAVRRCPIGLMSRDCRLRENVASNYVTISLGQRCAGDEKASLAFGVEEEVDGEKASDVYERIYGVKPKGSIVHLGWKHVAQLNGCKELLGLGWALSVNGVSRAIFGNEDCINKPSRYSACLLTDELGCVQEGIVDKRLLKRVGRFVLTDEKMLLHLLMRALDLHRFIVVDLGDARRVAKLPQEARRLPLMHIDGVVRMIYELCVHHDAFLWFVIPSPSPERQEMTLVAILSVYGEALLTSKTTRTYGIISATDLAVTWLRQLGIDPPPQMTGHAIMVAQADDAILKLQRLHTRTKQHFKNYRGAVIGAVVVCLLTLFFAITLGASNILHQRHSQLLGFFALSSFSLPLVLLLAGALVFPSPLSTFAFVVTFSLIMGTVMHRCFGGLLGANVLSLLLLLASTIDCFFSNALLRNSFIGYTPINGWRFYGIGNELAGALAPCCVISLSWLLSLPLRRTWKLLIAISFCFCVAMLVGMPNLGSNLGSALAIGACVSGVTVAFFLKGHRNKLIFILCAMGASFAVVSLAIAAYESLLGEMHSHVGQLIERISKFGVGALADAFMRKISIHAEVILHQRLYLVGIAFLIIFTLSLPKLRYELADANLGNVKLAIFFSCVVLWLMFLLNDTGALSLVTGLIVSISYVFIALSATSRLITSSGSQQAKRMVLK